MRSKEFAHGFDLSGSVDRFLRKGSFGKDDYRPCAPSIKLHQPPLPKREGRTAPSRSEIDCIACILRFRRLAAACLVVLCAVLPRLGAILRRAIGTSKKLGVVAAGSIKPSEGHGGIAVSIDPLTLFGYLGWASLLAMLMLWLAQCAQALNILPGSAQACSVRRHKR